MRTLDRLAVLASLLSLIVALASLEIVWSVGVISPAIGAAAVAALVAILTHRRKTKIDAGCRIFLIYSRDDLKAAQQLVERLTKDGFNPWLDLNEIAPGQQWQASAMEALQESSVAVVLVSEQFRKSHFAQLECSLALDSLRSPRKGFGPVIPVRLDASPVPANLTHIQWINLFDVDGYERLRAGLREIFPENRSPKASVA